MSVFFLCCSVLLLIIITLVIGNDGEEPSNIINDTLIIKNGVTYLTDATFNDYLSIHSKVTVLFVSDAPLHLYSLAVMFDFERAAHIANNISNMSIKFAVYAGNEDTEIHEDLEIEEYPVMKYFVHEQIIEHETKLKFEKEDQPPNEKEIENVEKTETENPEKALADIRRIDYNWKVLEHRLVTWLKDMNNPCYSVLDNIIDFQYFVDSYEISMVAYFDLENDDQNTIQMINIFDRVCKDFAFDHETQAYTPAFAIIINRKLSRRHKVINATEYDALSEKKRLKMQTFPALISYSYFKKHSWVFNGNALNLDEVWDFVEEERFPYIAKINGMNFLEYSTSHLPIVWICIDDDKDEYVARIERFYERIAKKFKNKLLFVWISSRNYIQHIRKLGAPWVPGLIMVHGRDKYLYPPKSNILSNIDVNAFLIRSLNGDQSLFYRSVSNKSIRQSMAKDRKLILESKSEGIGSVTEGSISDEDYDESMLKLHAHYVNGSHLYRTMRSQMFSDVNIVVMYYAPWDTRCERFTPQYEKVAEYFHPKLEDEGGNEDGEVLKSNVLLLKIDATANDIPEGVVLYPRIYLYRSDSYSSKIGHGIRYRMKRKAKRVISWILEMCDFFDEDTEEEEIMAQKWLKRKNILAQEKRNTKKEASAVNIQVIKDGEEEVTRVEMESENDLYSDLVDYYYFDGNEEFFDDNNGEKDDEELDDEFEYV